MLYVKDFCNAPAVTVQPLTSLKECLEIMEREKFRHLLVTEKNEETGQDMLKGIVVRRDIESALLQPSRIPQTPVEWIMSKNLITVEEKAPLIDALKLMNQYKYSGLPVVQGEALVGMFTETDVVKALIAFLEGEHDQ